MKSAVNKAFLVVLALTLGLLLFIRYKYCHIPLERDEGEYAYAGSLLLRGHYPYQDAYNMKFPGTYFMYALLMKLVGENIPGIRTGTYFIVLLTALILGGIAYLLTGEIISGLLSAIVYMAFLTTMIGEGLMANSELFVNLFVVAGIFVLFFFLYKRENRVLLFISGFLLSLGVIMKQYGYAFSLFAFVVLTSRFYRKPVRELLKDLIAFGLGELVPALLLLLWVCKNGLWQKFWFLAVEYAYAYVSMGYGNLPYTLSVIMSHAVPLFILAAISLLVLIFSIVQKEARNLIAWVAFSMLAFTTGRYMRLHYFILVYPALAVAVGYAYYKSSKIIGAPIVQIAISFMFILFFFMDREEQFEADPDCVFNQHYAGQMFLVMPKIAQRVNDFIPVSDKLSLFSSEPEIFFYSHRVSASGYIYNYPFFEKQKYASQMLHEYMREVEANPSRLFVYYACGLSDNNPNEYAFKKWWEGYSKKFVLKDVYVALSMDSGIFLGTEKIYSDTSWKNNGTRAEFWIKK